MPKPRQVLPDSYYLISRRCSQRQFLLRPDGVTNNAYLYCLIEAAQRFQIQILMMCAMSNHHHLALYDRSGNYPAFLEHLHKMIARSQNALLGRWEHFWSSGQTSVVRLEDHDAVVDKLVYVATNPVNDHLVDRVDHWPGINGLQALLSGRQLRATRPRHFFREDGPMPATVEMTIELPAALGDSEQVRAEVKQRVKETEKRAASVLAQTGRRVLGRRAVLAQSWRSAPATFEPRRTMSPRVATRNLWSRLEALHRNRRFVNAYAKARAAWLAGLEVVFPVGTYWLRCFANVVVEVA